MKLGLVAALQAEPATRDVLEAVVGTAAAPQPTSVDALLAPYRAKWV